MGDIRITAKKMTLEVVNIFVSGGLAALISYFDTQASIPAFAVGLILLRGFENWWKHKND